MTKVAVLIGVSEYKPGLTPLPAATKDVEGMRQILENPELGGFDEVKPLLNPDPVEMLEEIQAAFSSSRKTQDLVLLFFSGHGVRDERGNLYLATRITRKTERGELVKGTAVAARFVHDIMNDCRSKRQVVILDCCYSGAFAEGLLAKDDGSVDVRNQLGGEGRVLLASSTSLQYSFEQKGEDFSIYTHYLIEGIDTGAADRDNDGMVSVDELHEYAKEKVQDAVPAMKPEIYPSKEGYRILLAKAPIKTPSAPSAPVVPSPVEKNVSSAPVAVKPKPEGALLMLPNPPTSLQTSLTQQEYRDRQSFLDKVKNAWIKGVLEKSLHGQALIALGLEERLNAVDSPAALAWETPDQPRQTLPPGTRVIDQFDQLGTDRTLLILGEPGSGKTITVLELARDLINRAQQEVSLPMPVVLNLSSWKGGRQTTAEWLVQELHSQYQVPKQTGSYWIKTGQLLLLLDGLDEVKGDIRDACIQALNQFRQEHGHAEIVVCSRIKDYEALKHRLRFSAALYVQPLTEEQIHHYIAAAGAKLAAVSRALQTDTQLQELAKSPLMLNIIAIAYQGMSIEDLPSMTLEERRYHLFNAYIERMFSRRSATRQYPKIKTRHWLIWLAQRMVQESQTVFLLERMQPSWLPMGIQRHLHRIGTRMSVGLICGLSVGLISSVLPSTTNKGIDLIFTGLISGAISGLSTGLFSRLNSGLIIGLIVGLLSVLINTLLGLVDSNGLSINMAIIPINMAINVIIFMVVFLYAEQNVESINPIKWSWSIAKNKFIIGLIMGAFIAIPLLWLRRPNNHTNALLGLLLLMLTIGLVFGISLGFKQISEVKTTVFTNYGIRTAVANAAISGTIGGSISGLVFYIDLWIRNNIGKEIIWWIYVDSTDPATELFFGLKIGLSVGLIGGLINGQSLGLICLQHLILRIILSCNGYIPWNYARFLDYASERIFLQKVGGGYIFIHRLLLEHFSSLRLPNNRSASNL